MTMHISNKSKSLFQIFTIIINLILYYILLYYSISYYQY